MVSSTIRKYIALCLVCLCSSLFFLGLYQFNNKYSQDTIQAANGILVLSENNLQEAPLRFLVCGWAFYPDTLLSPEEIQDSNHYMHYISIGEQTNFSSQANPSPYGCGTYPATGRACIWNSADSKPYGYFLWGKASYAYHSSQQL